MKSPVLFGPTTDDVGSIEKYCLSLGNSFGAIGLKLILYFLSEPWTIFKSKEGRSLGFIKSS